MEDDKRLGELVRSAVREAMEAAVGELAFSIGEITLTEEDVRLIKEHVRLPPVTKLAVLAERVRCAMVMLDAGIPGAAEMILAEPADGAAQ